MLFSLSYILAEILDPKRFLIFFRVFFKFLLMRGFLSGTLYDTLNSRGLCWSYERNREQSIVVIVQALYSSEKAVKYHSTSAQFLFWSHKSPCAQFVVLRSVIVVEAVLEYCGVVFAKLSNIWTADKSFEWSAKANIVTMYMKKDLKQIPDTSRNINSHAPGWN